MSLRTRRWAWWLLVPVSMAWGCASPARVVQPEVVATLPGEEIARIDDTIRAEMERQKLVGVSVGVIRDGKIAYLHAYGLANREKNTPMTTATVVNWASNSKPLAAVMAMQLVDEKKLDLEADVRTYVPEFPEKSAKLTPRLLMCHESGMVHYSNGKVVGTKREYKESDPLADPVLALDKFNQSPLLFTPGDKTSYSTYGYILLSAVIQRAGREPYAAQIQRRIAKPLGLKSLQPDVDRTDMPDWAAGYDRRMGLVVPTPEEAHYWKHGGGAYKSNIADFARWAQALVTHRMVSPEAEKVMWTRQRLNDGNLTDWGLGFGLHETPAGLTVGHGGQQDEATSFMQINPQTGSGLVVLCNCGFADMRGMARKVLAVMEK